MDKQIFTTIQINQEIWAELNKRKEKSSETFIHVLNRLLDLKNKRTEELKVHLSTPGNNQITTKEDLTK